MYKIVADSSSNIKSETVASVPLKIITDEKEFIDDETYDTNEMVSYLRNYKGRSGSACPSREDWLDAFGDAEYVFCIAITSHLSGSYNSARLAKDEYESEHPGRRVYVIDSLSTGGEMELIADKLEELIAAGKSFDDICIEIEAYADKAHLIFCLKSLTNLVNNGRVSGTAAKISKLLNLRIVGRASTEGELEMLSKPRGEKNAVPEIIKQMEVLGFKGGKVIISHCLASEFAKNLADAIKVRFNNVILKINECGALCSFYAEEGGILVGFEG